MTTAFIDHLEISNMELEAYMELKDVEDAFNTNIEEATAKKEKKKVKKMKKELKPILKKIRASWRRMRVFNYLYVKTESQMNAAKEFVASCGMNIMYAIAVGDENLVQGLDSSEWGYPIDGENPNPGGANEQVEAEESGSEDSESEDSESGGDE